MHAGVSACRRVIAWAARIGPNVGWSNVLDSVAASVAVACWPIFAGLGADAYLKIVWREQLHGAVCVLRLWGVSGGKSYSTA